MSSAHCIAPPTHSFSSLDPFGEGQWPSAPVRTIEGRGAYHDDLHEGGGCRI